MPHGILECLAEVEVAGRIYRAGQCQQSTQRQEDFTGEAHRAFTVKPQGRAVQEHGAKGQLRARRQEDFVGEARQSFHDETAGPVDGQAWCQGWTAKRPLGQGWLHEAQPKAVTRSAKGQRQEAQRCNAKTLTRREDFAGEARQSFHGETAGPRPKLHRAQGSGASPSSADETGRGLSARMRCLRRSKRRSPCAARLPSDEVRAQPVRQLQDSRRQETKHALSLRWNKHRPDSRSMQPVKA